MGGINVYLASAEIRKVPQTGKNRGKYVDLLVTDPDPQICGAGDPDGQRCDDGRWRYKDPAIGLAKPPIDRYRIRWAHAERRTAGRDGQFDSQPDKPNANRQRVIRLTAENFGGPGDYYINLAPMCIDGGPNHPSGVWLRNEILVRLV